MKIAKSIYFLLSFSLFILLSCGQPTGASVKGGNEDNSTEKSGSTYESIDVNQAKELIANEENLVLLDVRRPSEHEAGHIPNSKLINIFDKDFDQQIQALDKEKTYVVYCRSGRRSLTASERMKSQGFEKLYNLEGDMLAWEREQ